MNNLTISRCDQPLETMLNVSVYRNYLTIFMYLLCFQRLTMLHICHCFSRGAWIWNQVEAVAIVYKQAVDVTEWVLLVVMMGFILSSVWAGNVCLLLLLEDAVSSLLFLNQIQFYSDFKDGWNYKQAVQFFVNQFPHLYMSF